MTRRCTISAEVKHRQRTYRSGDVGNSTQYSPDRGCFHLALVNPIDNLLTPRDAYQNNFNILQAISEALPKPFHGDIPGIEDPLCLCCPGWGKRRRSLLQSNRRRRLRRNLSFVTWTGELRRIVDGPECNIKLDQLLFTKKLLLLLLVHDQAFLGQCISCPLIDSYLARETLQVSSERTHVVYCTSVFLIDQIAGNSSKSSRVPLRKSVYRIDGVRSSSILPRLIATWKRRKSLMVARSGGGTPSLRRRGLVV